MPAWISSVRKTVFSVSRSGIPNETLLAPAVILQPGLVARIIRAVSIVIIPAL